MESHHIPRVGRAKVSLGNKVVGVHWLGRGTHATMIWQMRLKKTKNAKALVPD